MVGVAHRQCRQHEWMDKFQWRLSFSRAEIVLLNSWTPLQQIVYHMLRVFIKIERLTNNAENSDAATLSNYHIKTLMLWACELKPRIWWIDDLNLVRLSVELLHTLAVWLTDVRCPHYFIHNCNLFDPDNWYCSPLLVASRLMSVTEASLTEWFINNYVRKCAQHCRPTHDKVSRLFDDVSCRTKLDNAVSAVIDHRHHNVLMVSLGMFAGAQGAIALELSWYSLTVRSCLYWMRNLTEIDERLCVYFTAVTFLHVVHKTARYSLTDELLDVLSITCLQYNSARRCLNARHSSVLSLSQAAKLMEVIANNSRSTVQLIEIELSKAYLYRAFRCKDSDSDSIYCLANVYLAVLYYTTGQYQTAIDHCTLVTRSQDHSQCSSHVVQGEILPKIDDYVDTVLGLAELYQYVRTAVLNNHQHQTKYVTGFTAELFASYLIIKCLSVTECRQFMQTSSNDKFERYAICIRDIQQLLIGDVLLFLSVCRLLKFRRIPVCPKPQHTPMNANNYYRPTSDLVELLQKSAVEYLTTYRQLEARDFGSVGTIVTTDFEALYAYKRGDYQRCLQLSTQNVHTLLCGDNVPDVAMLPEFVQFLDGDIVSLTALTVLINPECRNANKHRCIVITQGTLSLYLMTQCQLKLRRSVTVLTDTLDYIELIQSKHRAVRTLDHMTLKLIERRVTEYVSTHFVAVDPAVTIRPTS